VQRASSSRTLIKLTQKMITDKSYVQKQKRNAKHILDKMDDPVEKIISLLKHPE
jgi:hypothetical protein